MKIYAAEIKDGLSDNIQSQKSIAYLCAITPLEVQSEKEKIVAKLSDNKSLATTSDVDLYYHKSILVTSSWNKNDDVFLPEETWKARFTPIDKPTNNNHNEKEIVGHMVDTWAVDAEYNLLPEDIEIKDLPSKFHIINAAVLYKVWDDEALFNRTQELIAAIEDGTKYVSMEALFTDFDYAIEDDKEPCGYKVVSREKAAYLTKHLRAYGGKGIFKGKKIGRAIKNIVFSGKGYVDKPANPESIIINDINIFEEKTKAGVTTNSNELFNNGEDLMNTEELQAKVTDLESQLQVANQAKAELEANKVAAEELATAKTELEAIKSELAQAKLDIDSAKAEVVAKTETISVLEAKNTELSQANDTLKIDILKINRLSTLVDGGIAKDVASVKVEKYLNLSDEQFADISAELIEAKKKCGKSSQDMEEEDEMAEAQDANAQNATQQVLDNAQAAEDVNLSAASEKETQIREVLAKAIADGFGLAQNDGE